jgi:MFS family permease
MPEGAPPTPSLTNSNRSASPLVVLRHPHFRLIWIAAFASYLGNWFEFVAVRWIVTEQASSLAAQGVSAEDWMFYLSVAQLCPTLLLGLYGGIVADSVNRRTLLVITQLAMMIIALAMAAAAFSGHASRWALLVLVLAQGIVVPFNTPAWQVLTPRLVPKNELTLAITLSGISFNVARTVGPAIAGVIMALFKDPTASEETSRGAAALLLFNALTFMGVMLAVLRTPDAPAPPENHGAWKHPALAIRRGNEALAWVWRGKGPRAILFAIVVFAVLATPVMPMMSVVVHDVHKGSEDTFGVFIAVMGIGAVTGGLAMKHVPHWYPMHHFIPTSCMLGGVFILVFALATDSTWALFTLFFVGVFWMWGFNSTAAAMQNLVPDHMRGRVLAVVNTIAMGLMPLGPLIAAKAGHAAEQALAPIQRTLDSPLLAPQLGLAIPAILLIAAGVVMITYRTPEVDGLTPGQPGFERKPGFLRGLFATAHRPSPSTDHARSPADHEV